jgi:hypothetical protein
MGRCAFKVYYATHHGCSVLGLCRHAEADCPILKEVASLVHNEAYPPAAPANILPRIVAHTRQWFHESKLLCRSFLLLQTPDTRIEVIMRLLQEEQDQTEQEENQQ